jgi:hypothetical protein
MTDDKRILEVLSRLEQRMTELEGGMNNSDAWRSAVADWNSRPKLAQSHFPTFESVKPDFQTIISGCIGETR